jgi:hypothetical protein
MEPAVRNGESAKGSPITLLGSFYTRWKRGGALLAEPPVPIVSSALTCNAMVLGVHLPSTDGECFDRCSLTIPNLERWLADRPFDVDIDEAGNISVKYTRPQERRFAVPRCVGDFRFSPAVAPPIDVWDDASIQHRTYVHIEPDAPKSFEWFVRIASETERLFTLLMGRVVQATRTCLICNGNEADVLLPKRRIDQPEMGPVDFLTRFPEIVKWFPQMLRSWYGESDDIRHALDLVFASLQRPGWFLETRFLPFVQAVEVYSRAVNPGRIVEKREYKPIRKEPIRSIPEGTPKELRKAIVRSLGYANERTLRERFFALFKELQPQTTDLFCVDRNEFVRGIVDTRNYLTHYSCRSKPVLKGKQLHWATVKLQTMMKVLLLIRLGIPEAVVQSFLKKNYALSQERRAWREVPEVGSEQVG